jgi:hypothetical protein
MLLRNLAEHARRQDWFLAGVEIMIVVVGIFIALQVEGWNQQRENISLERQYLERLQNDFECLLEVEKFGLRWNDVRLAQGRFIREVIEKEHLPDDKRPSFEYGLYFLGVVNRARLSWGTVDELRATGNIQLIRDWSLRQHLTDVENEFKWAERYEDETAQMALHYREELYKHYRILTSPDADKDRQLEMRYDESVFWMNPILANMIAKLIEYQEQADENFRENLSRLETLRDHIASIRKNQFGDTYEGERLQEGSCRPFVRQS